MTFEKTFMNRFDTFKLVAFWMFFILLTGEIVLRFLGYQEGILLQPQEIKNTWVNLDGGTPALIHLFEPDSFGLLKPKMPLSTAVMVDSLVYIPLKEKLVKTQINQDGFRSHEFNCLPKDKIKVLFIGDSFVFGFDANPFDHSFVDQLGRINPNLYPLNAGIPGGDLATYATVAEQYIPKIKPQFVITCLYTNDLVYYPKELTPCQVNNIFMTDKGILFKENYQYKKDSIQVFANHVEAYNALISEYTTRYITPKKLKWILDRSVFLAQCYEWLDIRCHKRFGTIKKKENHSGSYTQRIKDIAEANGAMPIFTIIPHQKNVDQEKNIKFFKQMTEDSLYFPVGINKNHYQAPPRIHFNNSGHQFYAEFLNDLIKQQGVATYK